ncbi:CLUMA_CG014525, isoform A [Clunio marinus]|uniref:CLUMA_CG014525, isoform A n=1 Tax=Clunio marinus TaxID=568069 RepID=A0A1J1IMV9_9DIPT|nr:CLUMA_CG014525, isoform A [Clunio marinus]
MDDVAGLRDDVFPNEKKILNKFTSGRIRNCCVVLFSPFTVLNSHKICKNETGIMWKITRKIDKPCKSYKKNCKTANGKGNSELESCGGESAAMKWLMHPGKLLMIENGISSRDVTYDAL